MNNALILDVETTISNKGNPFDQTNKLVVVGLRLNGYNVLEYYPDKESLKKIQYQIDNRLLVGFNLKFDLHWLRRIGIDISKIKVWDCQLAEFILSYQQNKYPSLDGAAEKYRFPKKLDIVKTEFWDKQIDTDKIPRNILSDYLTQDLVLTEQVYLKQLEQFKSNGLMPLFRLQCADLLVLQEMEYNGIYFDVEKARKHAGEIHIELNEITKELSKYTNGLTINFNSNDHVSALLYGGTIGVDDKIPIGVYKSGVRQGQVKYKNIVKEYPLPRLVEPLKGTETKKSIEGKEYWEVNETVLRKLKLSKQAKVVVDLLNKYSELEKLRGTYLNGYSDLIDTMNWPARTLHSNFNMCVAVTGRLSSSHPNMQNCDPKTKIYMETTYEN